jgi:hypothetical protein
LRPVGKYFPVEIIVKTRISHDVRTPMKQQGTPTLTGSFSCHSRKQQLKIAFLLKTFFYDPSPIASCE